MKRDGTDIVYKTHESLVVKRQVRNPRDSENPHSGHESFDYEGVVVYTTHVHWCNQRN